MNIVIGWPEAIYMILTLLGIIIQVHKAKEGKDIFTAFMATVLIYILLFWGGFFS